MAATITETYAQELVARATAAGITEDEFKTVTGWSFNWAENTTHNRARVIESMIAEAKPAAPAYRTVRSALYGTGRVYADQPGCTYYDDGSGRFSVQIWDGE